jgi:hypothetical protein
LITALSLGVSIRFAASTDDASTASAPFSSQWEQNIEGPPVAKPQADTSIDTSGSFADNNNDDDDTEHTSKRYKRCTSTDTTVRTNVDALSLDLLRSDQKGLDSNPLQMMGEHLEVYNLHDHSNIHDRSNDDDEDNKNDSGDDDDDEDEQPMQPSGTVTSSQEETLTQPSKKRTDQIAYNGTTTTLLQVQVPLENTSKALPQK